MSVDNEFVKDYFGVAIYKNANYSKWLDNGKYVAKIGNHILIIGDSIKFVEAKIKDKLQRMGRLNANK